jgi:transposase
MDGDLSDIPDDLEALKAALIAERGRRIEAEANAVIAEADAVAARAEAAAANAKVSSAEALIAHMKLQLEKLRREFYGTRSECTARLIEQMELQLKELETSASEDDLTAERAAARAGTTTVSAFARRRPARKPFPEHLPRERVVVPVPTACACCGSSRLSKLGEDVTETLEVIPRQWKVIQHVREKFTCRDCEKISQAPAPFHVIPRGWAGPSLLAMILFEKFGQHQPLNRQAERYAREGVPLSLSTLADQVGACVGVLAQTFERIQAHVFPLSVCMATTPRSPCSPRAKPIRRTSGLTSATIVRSGARRRRQPYSTTLATEPAFIPDVIWRVTPASCRPTPTADTNSSTRKAEDPTRSWRLPAGPMRVASSSCSPMLRRAPDDGRRTKRRRRSSLSHWRPFARSTSCSTSSAL